MKQLLLAVLLCGGIAWGQTETKVLCYGSADSDELFWIEAGDTCHADRKFRTAWSANLKIAGRDNELDTLRVELAALRKEVEELKKQKQWEPFAEPIQLGSDPCAKGEQRYIVTMPGGGKPVSVCAASRIYAATVVTVWTKSEWNDAVQLGKKHPLTPHR
jgi:hypothetical protein